MQERFMAQQHALLQQQQQQQQPLPQVMRPQYDTNAPQGDLGMFSHQFPNEAPLMLNPTDPLTSMFMAGSGHPAFNSMPSYYDVMGETDSTFNLKSANTIHPSFDGINATLAPSALDLSIPDQTGPISTVAGSMGSLNAPVAFSKQQQIDGAAGEVCLKPPQLSRTASTQGSGIAEDWVAFIDDKSWE